MKIALDLVGGLLVVIMLVTGVGKIKKIPVTIDSLIRAGAQDAQIYVLGILDLLSAFGLILGIWNLRLAHITAVCLVLYFLGAVGFHLRQKNKAEDLAPALVVLTISLAVLILEVKR